MISMNFFYLVALIVLRKWSIYQLVDPGGSVVKNTPANAGEAGDSASTPQLGRSPGEGNGNLLQYSCLGNSMNRGAWWAAVHGFTKSQT